MRRAAYGFDGLSRAFSGFLGLSISATMLRYIGRCAYRIPTSSAQHPSTACLLAGSGEHLISTGVLDTVQRIVGPLEQAVCRCIPAGK